MERFFEDPTKPKKLRVPGLNKYLKHHRLEKHLKSTKNDKVKVITRHWLLQMNPEGTDLLQTRLRETEMKLKMNLCHTVITMIVMKTITVEAKAAVMRRMKMIAGDREESSDVILAFIDDEEVERPATTRSGRAITRRSGIDFFLFIIFSTNSERAGTFLFC